MNWKQLLAPGARLHPLARAARLEILSPASTNAPEPVGAVDDDRLPGRLV